MPGIIIEAYLGLLPVLVAEENMNMASVLQVGSGLLDKADHHRVVSRWQSAMGQQRPAATPEMMTHMGFDVVQE